MRLTNLLDDDDAVSPVIGVILMVAITVILAAVIASFVLGLGNQQDVAPQASFSFDYEADNYKVTISHDSGDPLREDELYIRGEGFNDTGENAWADYIDNTPSDGSFGTAGNEYWEATVSGSTEGTSAVVAGDTIELMADGDYDISVVWESVDTDSSTTLADDTGPAA